MIVGALIFMAGMFGSAYVVQAAKTLAIIRFSKQVDAALKEGQSTLDMLNAKGTQIVMDEGRPKLMALTPSVNAKARVN
jgi:hypothetical protein